MVSLRSREWDQHALITPQSHYSRIKCTLSKFVGVTKLCGAVNTPKGWDTTQRDLDRFEQWARETVMRFNKAKSKSL